jgi:hypothetical protein
MESDFKSEAKPIKQRIMAIPGSTTIVGSIIGPMELNSAKFD